MPISANHYPNFAWNTRMRSASRTDTSSRARNRFRLRTLFASMTLPGADGGLIHLINLAHRPSDPKVTFHAGQASPVKKNKL
jgi:hypothetical protein